MQFFFDEADLVRGIVHPRTPCRQDDMNREHGGWWSRYLDEEEVVHYFGSGNFPEKAALLRYLDERGFAYDDQRDMSRYVWVFL